MDRFEEYYRETLSRRGGERKIYTQPSEEKYRDRLKGAFFARMAGCTLGAPVEGWSIDQMEEYAQKLSKRLPLRFLLRKRAERAGISRLKTLRPPGSNTLRFPTPPKR